MSSSSSSSKSTSETHFQANKFHGQKTDFKRFEDEIDTALRSHVGEDGVRYLFTKWPRRADQSADQQGEYDTGPEFTTVAYLPSLEGVTVVVEKDEHGAQVIDIATGTVILIQVTPAMRKDRREENESIRKMNERIHRIKTGCMRILTERSSESLNIKYAQLKCPHTSWRWLCAEFGPISLGQEDIGTEFLAVMAITMDYEEHFHEFMITFSRRMSHVQGTPAQARGLLLSDRNTNVLKKQVLPDRLMEAARRCKDDSKMYDECIVYLRNKDQEQHAAGQLKPNSKKVMALSNQEAAPRSTTRKCYNCGNFGHLQGDCLSNFCGYCKKFDVNHHSGECPKRGTDNKSSTSTQEQKKVQVEARKTRSRGKAEKEQAGKSKRKSSEGPKPLKRLKSEAKEESMAESEGEMDDEEFDDEESSEPRTSKADGAWMRPNGDGKRLCVCYGQGQRELELLSISFTKVNR